MARVITYQHGMILAEEICNALGLDPSEVQRVIIDISVDQIVRAYVEMIVTDKILNVDWAVGLKGAEVMILGKE